MKYCYSTDGERFTGSFDTEVDAAAEAFEKNDDIEITVAEVRDPSEWMTAASIGRRLFDDLSEMLSEEVGEAAECFDWTYEQQDKLGEAVLRFVAEQGGWNCFGVKNPQTISLLSKVIKEELARRCVPATPTAAQTAAPPHRPPSPAAGTPVAGQA